MIRKTDNFARPINDLQFTSSYLIQLLNDNMLSTIIFFFLVLFCTLVSHSCVCFVLWELFQSILEKRGVVSLRHFAIFSWWPLLYFPPRLPLARLLFFLCSCLTAFHSACFDAHFLELLLLCLSSLLLFFSPPSLSLSAVLVFPLVLLSPSPEATAP